MEAEEHDPTIDPEWTLTEEAANWYRERINQGNGFAVVAQEDQTVIGYAIGVTESAEEFRTTDTLAELETMYLQPQYRGQGIGSKLVQEFKDWAREKGADRLRVEASAENEDAIRFYQENGFEDYSVTLEEDF
ncbi:GNAT family N-acetyltransferase [Candidatus Nanohalobium constans]|uniref:GNAT family N-acetyltransferase n=1 Tax=Candidatus Nanohalobium constans TaxID=2565781 RepID=A0A5Q0UFK1_9ARCH|nr:GNAT family N-acetyltransferase [Candidatus Nanohalobium constans]QGA80393.1 GNAT family N-acetyltransferase [Candidatus Nanohalobium constans]